MEKIKRSKVFAGSDFRFRVRVETIFLLGESQSCSSISCTAQASDAAPGSVAILWDFEK
jgi:hypothetical protein